MILILNENIFFLSHQLIGKNLIKIFEPISKSSGPCRYFRLPKKQSNQCRKDPGLPDQIKEARRLTIKYCEEQFRYDRWNCSIQTRGKGNVFNKVNKQIKSLNDYYNKISFS